MPTIDSFEIARFHPAEVGRGPDSDPPGWFIAEALPDVGALHVGFRLRFASGEPVGSLRYAVAIAGPEGAPCLHRPSEHLWDPGDVFVSRRGKEPGTYHAHGTVLGGSFEGEGEHTAALSAGGLEVARATLQVRTNSLAS